MAFLFIYFCNPPICCNNKINDNTSTCLLYLTTGQQVVITRVILLVSININQNTKILTVDSWNSFAVIFGTFCNCWTNTDIFIKVYNFVLLDCHNYRQLTLRYSTTDSQDCRLMSINITNIPTGTCKFTK